MSSISPASPSALYSKQSTPTEAQSTAAATMRAQNQVITALPLGPQPIPLQLTGAPGSIESLIQNLLQVLVPLLQTLASIAQQLVANLFGQSTPQGDSKESAVPAGTNAAAASPGTSETQAAEPAPSAPSSPAAAAAGPDAGIQGAPRHSGTSKLFQFKPFSDKDKQIAILLPIDLTKKTAGVDIIGPDGKLKVSGKYSGIDQGSGREVFRFSKQGTDIPAGSVVRIRLQDGSEKHVTITEPSRELKRRLA